MCESFHVGFGTFDFLLELDVEPLYILTWMCTYLVGN